MKGTKYREMFEALFLANDPGGYSAIKPIYDSLKTENCKLLLTGVAGDNDTNYMVQGDYLESVALWFESNPKAILVTGTSWKNENEIRAVNYCKKRGVVTVSIIDYWSNYKERFRLRENYLFPDYIFIMDEVSRKEAVNDGIPEKNLFIVGQPIIDAYVEGKKSQLSNGRALFLSQPIFEVNGTSLGYTEFDTVRDVVDACDNLGIPLDIKFHPKESKRFKSQYKKYEVCGDIEDIVRRYDVIIGMCTIGLLQCILIGKKTISYQPGLINNDPCITNKVGLTNGAYNYHELLKQLRADRNYVRKGNIDKPIWCDGKSTERCVRLLLDIYKNQKMKK